jgi:hypothetical protein
MEVIDIHAKHLHFERGDTKTSINLKAYRTLGLRLRMNKEQGKKEVCVTNHCIG